VGAAARRNARACGRSAPARRCSRMKESAEVARLPADPAGRAVPASEGRASMPSRTFRPLSIRRPSPGSSSSIARTPSIRPTCDGFEDSALDWLTGNDLNPNQRRSLLARLARPDYANLPKTRRPTISITSTRGLRIAGNPPATLVVAARSHSQAQSRAFERAEFRHRLSDRLQPGRTKTGGRRQALEAYLDRLAAFAERLVPAHNSLKTPRALSPAGVRPASREIRQRAIPGVSQAAPPRGLSLEDELESEAMKRFAGDLNANYEGATLLAPIRHR